jgi:hypothetical protein
MAVVVGLFVRYEGQNCPFVRYLCVIASKTALRGALVALNTGHKSGISGLEDVHKDLHRSALLHRVPLLGRVVHHLDAHSDISHCNNSAFNIYSVHCENLPSK